MKITNNIFESYLECRYKGFLSLQGTSGCKSDYERLRAEQKHQHKYEALKILLAQYKEKQGLEIPDSTPPILRQGHRLLMETNIDSGELRSYCDALERVSGKSDFGLFYYLPILFVAKDKVSRKDKLRLAFNGLVLSNLQKRQPEYGKIVYGHDFKTVRVSLGTYITAVKKLVEALEESAKNRNPPRLFLNSHCRICEFKDSCKAKAEEKDDLSLLAGISQKEIQRQNDKGIFTVTQYSYTFRPRRERKGGNNQRRPHSFALKALAIRTSKIYIQGKPLLPATNVQMYLDVEGDPEQTSFYLIGLLFVQNGRERPYSFWSDNGDEEEIIFSHFLRVVEQHPDFHLFHYGSYETKFLKKMGKKYGNTCGMILNKIQQNTTNVLLTCYSNVYFPTYTNELKDLGNYLGFSWTNGITTGIQAILRREEWKKTRDEELKRQLIRYNIEDCQALKKITEFISSLNFNGDSEPEKGNNQKTVCVRDVKSDAGGRKTGGRHWGAANFPSPDLDYINRCAYFDYQREKVYIRTNKNILKIQKRRRKKKHRKLYGRINKFIEFNAPLKCILCRSQKLAKAGKFTRVVIDLKFFPGGMKAWATKYLIRRYRCAACNKSSTPRKYQSIRSKYGHNLISWVIYQNIENGLSGGQIARTLTDVFSLPISENVLSAQLSQQPPYITQQHTRKY